MERCKHYNSIYTGCLIRVFFLSIQGSTVNVFSNKSLTINGFTGVRVFNEKVSDVFKGTDVTESFLYITVMEGKWNK